MPEHKKTAVVDFDNTISGYDKWRGPKVLGPPIPYARDAILEMLEWGWRVVVFTTREAEPVVAWLKKHGFPPIPVNDCSHNPPNTSGKPIAEVYFDDRDAHVVGGTPYNWHAAMKRVRRKYQPPLDTHVDDASAWSSWVVRVFLAPVVRARFRSSLAFTLTAEEIYHDEKLTKDQRDAMLDHHYGLDVMP
jgi:hypothetical protein